MKKSAIVFVFAVFLSLTAVAQSVQEGVSNFYAERYQSAKSVFDKLLAANPNNLEAVYWLGQTYLAMNDVSAARNLYQRSLAANGNAPLIIVGMGHVNLLDGKKAEARQQFESAITASRGKKGNDPAVLTAIGRANVSSYSDRKPLGDLDYAIAKLNEAAAVAATNPEVFLNLGNAYRKKHMGSEAVLAYRKAGNFAPALYRTAMLYKTQSNWEVVLENLNSATQADPKFAPAYLDLYDYNLNVKRDFNAAQTFAEKYRSNSDPSVDNDYLVAQTHYVKNEFADAIRVGKNIIAKNADAKPRVYRLLAYSELGAKDTAAACGYVNQFLSKADDDDLRGEDYLLHATACANGNPNIVREDIFKAVSMDSVLSRQINLINQAIATARQNSQRLLEGELRLYSYQLRHPNVDKAELISYIAVPLYFGGAYERADSVAKVYIQQAPDSVHGYYWSALASMAIDTAMTQARAIPAYEKVLTLAEANKDYLRLQGVNAARTLAVYYNNIKADRAAALAVVARGLSIDPTNESLLGLQKALTPRQGNGTKTETKVKTSENETKVKTKPKGR